MITPITLTVPHRLGATEARRRLDEGFSQLERQFGAGGLAQVERRWEGDRLVFQAKAVGQTVSGWMQAGPDEVRMEVLLPGFLGVIASKIRGRLQKQGQLLLEKK